MFLVLLILLSSVALISSSLISSSDSEQQTGGFKRSFNRGKGNQLIKSHHKQQQQQKLTIGSKNTDTKNNDDDPVGLDWYYYWPTDDMDSSDAESTWSGPQTGTSDIRWRCITSDSTGTNLAAGTQNSGIYYSTNGGISWIQSAGAPISIGDEVDIYNGLIWTAIASSSSGQFVVAGNMYWESSAVGQLWTSINYGQSFSLQVDSPEDHTYYYSGSLAMSSDGTKVIAGQYIQGVSRYTLDASTGALETYGSVSASGSYVEVVSSDSSFNKLTYGAITVFSAGGIYYTSNGKSLNPTWTLSNAPTNEHWAGITSSANGNYLAAISRSSGRDMYTSQDSGATWNKLSAPTGVGYPFSGIASSSSGRIMAVTFNGENGYEGSIHLSYDYGQSWQASTSASVDWFGVAISNDGKKIVGAAAAAFTTNLEGTAITIGGGLYTATVFPPRPTRMPSKAPSRKPTASPTKAKSAAPTARPTKSKTYVPTAKPNKVPSKRKPTAAPSKKKPSKPTKSV